MSIGDVGPAGGWIFFIDEAGEHEGWTYLEAAPEEAEGTEIPWGGRGTEVGVEGQGIGIGTGAANTAAIVAALDLAGVSDEYAARFADELEVTNDGDTFSDWFLPSRDELDLMHKNLSENGIGGFFSDDNYPDYVYWSSTEIETFDDVDPEEQAFSTAFGGIFSGGNAASLKDTEYRVRAVRAY
ncbi:MAG: DUF1566 domain-containing protein [Spirochaetaceae bacterium]|nr:MAG: DUF1566 domain-containing protein [Spirochaetaceae bacterium]